MANMQATVGKRSQEEALRTRNRILDNAEVLFARFGFGGVSVREIAKASTVHHHTIQHHFGSKEELYERVLNRWDDEVASLLEEVIVPGQSLEAMIPAVVDHLFEFMLGKREWVALTARAVIGYDQPRRVQLKQHGWVHFIDKTLSEHKLGSLELDLGLLMITVEGILNNHLLARKHYSDLYGCDLDNETLKIKTKDHLKKVLTALVSKN